MASLILSVEQQQRAGGHALVAVTPRRVGNRRSGLTVRGECQPELVGALQARAPSPQTPRLRNMAAAVAKAGPIGPMQALPGTGGPEFFKVADKMGWQGSYTPEDFCSAYEVSKAVNNPVLVRSLPADITTAQVELAAKAFGKVRMRQNDQGTRLIEAMHVVCMVGTLCAWLRRYNF